MKKVISPDILVNEREKKEYNDLVQTQKELDNVIKQYKQYDLTVYKTKLEDAKLHNTFHINENRLVELREKIGLENFTTTQLIAEKKRISEMLDNITQNTKLWKKYYDELDSIENQLTKVGGKTNDSLNLKSGSMNFVAIDFETATSSRNSVCEIGLAFVEDNKIIDTRSWLVKPKGNQYDSFNISIHGITPADTANKPEFGIVWKEVLPLIDGKTIIAHNARFDMYVLKDTLDTYQLDYPNVKTMCSYILSKKAFPGLISYNLKSLMQCFEIKTKHHKAEDDAKACAEICIKVFKECEINDFDDISDKFKIIRGVMSKENRSFTPSHIKQIRDNSSRTRLDVRSIIGDASKHDIENIFYEQSVVFTGTLSSMTRQDALQIIADIGGIPGNNVNKTTNFLVVGQQDYRIVGDAGLSGKQQKALQLLENGADIEIISEDDFLKNINF